MLCICICLVLVFVFSSYRHAAGAQHKGRLWSARYQPVPLPCLFCLSREHSPQWQGNQHIARPRGEILQNGRANCSPFDQMEVKIKHGFASCISTTMANQILFVKSNWKLFLIHLVTGGQRIDFKVQTRGLEKLCIWYLGVYFKLGQEKSKAKTCKKHKIYTGF